MCRNLGRKYKKENIFVCLYHKALRKKNSRLLKTRLEHSNELARCFTSLEFEPQDMLCIVDDGSGNSVLFNFFLCL